MAELAFLHAPGLPEALERAMADGVPYVILDGKIFVGGAGL